MPMQTVLRRKPYSPRPLRSPRPPQRSVAIRGAQIRPDAVRVARAREVVARRSFGLALVHAEETYVLAVRRLEQFDHYLGALHTYFRAAGYLSDAAGGPELARRAHRGDRSREMESQCTP
jgi:hypothetical protein